MRRASGAGGKRQGGSGRRQSWTVPFFCAKRPARSRLMLFPSGTSRARPALIARRGSSRLEVNCRRRVNRRGQHATRSNAPDLDVAHCCCLQRKLAPHLAQRSMTVCKQETTVDRIGGPFMCRVDDSCPVGRRAGDATWPRRRRRRRRPPPDDQQQQRQAYHCQDRQPRHDRPARNPGRPLSFLVGRTLRASAPVELDSLPAVVASSRARAARLRPLAPPLALPTERPPSRLYAALQAADERQPADTAYA